MRVWALSRAQCIKKFKKVHPLVYSVFLFSRRMHDPPPQQARNNKNEKKAQRINAYAEHKPRKSQQAPCASSCVCVMPQQVCSYQLHY